MCLQDGIGWAGIKFEVLEALVRHAVKHGLPRACSGDYNMASSQIMQAERTQRLRVRVVETDEDACPAA